MKYKCFCHRENYMDLTKEELTVMIRGDRRMKIIAFIDYYNIPIDEYFNFLRIKGLNVSGSDRNQIQDYKSEQRELARLEKENEQKEKEINWTDVDTIPKQVIYAMFNVEFEEVNGKRYYDVEQYEKAKQELQKRMSNHYYKFDEDKTEKSSLKSIDLKAMRMFRGYTQNGFSRLTSMPLSYIRDIEVSKGNISKHIANMYIGELAIKKRHIVQLREIITGKAENIVDDRTIPTFIKVKVFGRDKGKCVRCSSENKLHYHHIKHFAEGGRHTEDNLMLLCASCHADEHEGERAYHMLKKMARED